MRHIFIIAFAALIFMMMSCDPERRTKKIIQDYMKTNTKYVIYTPVSYDKPKGIYHIDDKYWLKKYSNAALRAQFFISIGDCYPSMCEHKDMVVHESVYFTRTGTAMSFHGKYDALMDSIDKYKTILHEIEKHHPLKYRRLIIHKFKTENMFGATVVDSLLFIFNEDLSKIIEVTNTEDAVKEYW